MTLKWQRPLEKIYGKDDRVTFLPLDEGETLPPATIPKWIKTTAAASVNATVLQIETEGNNSLKRVNAYYLAFIDPVTGEEYTVELDGDTVGGSTIAITALEQAIPANSYAYLPHKLIGMVSFNSGERGKDYATSTPLNLVGWETVQPTTRSNEATAETEFYALGADYLTLQYCALNNIQIWLEERTNTPKPGFKGEIRSARYYVSGPSKTTSGDTPMVSWKFRRNGPEFFSRAEKV